jgi:hypothetical protein
MYKAEIKVKGFSQKEIVALARMMGAIVDKGTHSGIHDNTARIEVLLSTDRTPKAIFEELVTLARAVRPTEVNLRLADITGMSGEPDSYTDLDGYIEFVKARLSLFETEGWLDSDDPSVADWLTNFDNGVYASKDVMTQIAAGWCDWFCSDDSLAGRTKRLAPKIRKLSKSPKVDVNKMCLSLKNCCPGSGKVYDTFAFCDRKTDDVVYSIAPKSGHYCEFGVSSVYGYDANGKWDEVVHGTWKDVLAYFGL